MPKFPRKLSLVQLKKEWAADPASQTLPFIHDMPLIFLGEIPNMPDHGVFIGHKSGLAYSGFHIPRFVELSESEV
jgi:hypothetical protein